MKKKKPSRKIKIDADIYKELVNKNKLILKTHQQFRSGKHSVFTEEINKITFQMMIKETNLLI